MLAEQIDSQGIKSSPMIPGLDQVREKISLFGGVSDAQMALLQPYLKVDAVNAGGTVFEQGQLPCNVYVVLSGEINLQITREDNTLAKMSYMPGDCFGETAVIGIQPQLGQASAKCDAQVLVMSRTCLLDLAGIDVGLFGLLMMNIAREVSRRLHTIATTSATESEYPILRA